MSEVRYFVDHVAKMVDEDGRVRVHFALEPAIYWVDPGQMELVNGLADAAEAGRPVSIAWEAETSEILGVKPA